MRRFSRSIVYFILASFLLSHDFSSGLHAAVHIIAGDDHSTEQSFSLGDSATFNENGSSGRIPSCLLSKLIKAASGDTFQAQANAQASFAPPRSVSARHRALIASINDAFTHFSRGPPALLSFSL